MIKHWKWIAAAAAAGAVYVFWTRKQHPVIAGPGYPTHLTTWGEAFKMAFLGSKYPEPVSVPVGPDGTRTVSFSAIH